MASAQISPSSPWSPARAPARAVPLRALENVLLAAAYVLSARVGQALAIPPGNVTPVWIPSGLILAAVLLRGPWLWPGIFAGAFAGNIWAYVADPTGSVPAALGAATANGAGDAIGIVVGARLMLRRAPRMPFERPSHVGAFLAFGVVFSSFVSALFGVSSLCAVGILPWQSFGYTALTWFLGDGVGALIVTPLLLVWVGSARRVARLGEAAVFAFLLAVVSGHCLELVPYGTSLRLPFFVVTPLLMWAVLRMDERVTFTAVALVAGLSVVATANGHGPFVAGDLNMSLLQLQSFVAVVVVTVLFFHATTAERSASRNALQELNEQLELRVADRTAQLESELRTRERLEVERNQLAERMQHRQKLESLGVLAGGIAHDFNNLLVGMLGNADLALQDLPADSPVRGAVEDVVRAAQQAASLANQMLAYSGRGATAVEPVDLGAIVADLERLLRASVGAKVQLRLELAGDLPRVHGAGTPLRQLVMNLVINAAEAYGPDGGVVVVRTAHRELVGDESSDGYGVQGPAAGRHVVLEVVDRGCGMDAATRSRMFEPFFSTKFTGRGLGMATTLGIVRAHGGIIRVDSAPGSGTTMSVYLPVAEASAEPMSVEPRVAPASVASGRRVLVVDDDEAVLKVASRLLVASGHEVVGASSGEQALETVAADPGRFDCVLLDLTMPSMDGAETLRRLRRLCADLPVVLTSGFSVAEMRTMCAGEEAVFLQKPYLTSELEAAIDAAVQRRRRG